MQGREIIIIDVLTQYEFGYFYFTKFLTYILPPLNRHVAIKIYYASQIGLDYYAKCNYHLVYIQITQHMRGRFSCIF